jgi:hypothetical protein
MSPKFSVTHTQHESIAEDTFERLADSLYI